MPVLDSRYKNTIQADGSIASKTHDDISMKDFASSAPNAGQKIGHFTTLEDLLRPAYMDHNKSFADNMTKHLAKAKAAANTKKHTRKQQKEEPNESRGALTTMRERTAAILAEYEAKLTRMKEEFRESNSGAATMKTEIEAAQNAAGEKGDQMRELQKPGGIKAALAATIQEGAVNAEKLHQEKVTTEQKDEHRGLFYAASNQNGSKANMKKHMAEITKNHAKQTGTTDKILTQQEKTKLAAVIELYKENMTAQDTAAENMIESILAILV